MRVHGNGIWRLRNSVFSGFSRKLSFYPHLRVIKPWSKITDLSFSEEHVNAKKVKKKTNSYFTAYILSRLTNTVEICKKDEFV